MVETVVTLVAPQGVDDVAAGKISEELVLSFDASTVMTDEASGQKSLVRVDKVSQAAVH